MKTGLIDLNIMGKPMARNLLKAGYDLTISDLSQASVGEIVTAGAKAATDAEISETCDVVLTMVPNSPRVGATTLGKDGMAAHMKSGSVFTNMSSIDPVASKEIAAELARRGIEMLGAPVFSDEPKAIDGTLSFIVGGRQEIFGQYKGLLDAMGVFVVRCGDMDVGDATKLTSQIIVTCNIQAPPEALTPTKMTGVDPELVLQTIRGGLTGLTVMNAKAPMMIEDNDKPSFRTDLHIKDLNNILDCAHTVGPPLPMTTAVQEVFQWLHNDGCDQDDRSSIAKYYKKLTGVESL